MTTFPASSTSAPKRKIIVTGGLGYIGSHVVLSLLENGSYDPIVIDNCHNAQPVALERCAEIASAKLGRPVSPPAFHQVDLRDTPALREVFAAHTSADAPAPVWGVIHLAALKAVGESSEMPLEYYDVNVGGTISLLKVMAEFNTTRLVFSSSATVYGAPEIIPIPESSPLAPESPYGLTKGAVETLLEAVTKAKGKNAGLKAISVRYFNPAGAHPSARLGEEPSGRPNNLLPLLAQMATGRIKSTLTVYGEDYPTRDGTPIRDYIHIMDLAEGHVLALAALADDASSGTGTGTGSGKPVPAYRALNLGRGVGLTVFEMIQAMREATGLELPYTVGPRRAGDVPNLTADPTRAEAELGFKAKRGLKEMCEDLWRFQTRNDAAYIQS